LFDKYSNKFKLVGLNKQYNNNTKRIQQLLEYN